MAQEQIQRSMSRSSRHTRELARKLSKLTEVQAAVGWGLILLIIALLGVIYLNQSSRIAAVGRHVQDLQYELSELNRENAGLERDIAQAQSITKLQKEAAELGFQKAQPANTEYLVISNYPSEELISTATVNEIAEPVVVESMMEALRIVIDSKLDELMRGESREQ